MNDSSFSSGDVVDQRFWNRETDMGFRRKIIVSQNFHSGWFQAKKLCWSFPKTLINTFFGPFWVVSPKKMGKMFFLQFSSSNAQLVTCKPSEKPNKLFLITDREIMAKLWALYLSANPVNDKLSVMRENTVGFFPS